MDKRPKLCVVVPCYNEEESIDYYFQAMDEVGATLPMDLIYVLVNDGSHDGTLEKLRFFNSERPDIVHYVSFSRNFGKEAALEAGLIKALSLASDFVAVMDADLQDPPLLLKEMCEKVLSGTCDIAAAHRTTRKGESPIRSWFAGRFYALMNSISDVEMKDGARDFRVMKCQVVRAVLDLPECNRFSKGIFSWVGFKTEWVAYENVERKHGTTSWSFSNLLRYAVEGILAFSTVPLEIISFAGLLMFIFALIFFLFVVIRALIFGDPVAGWPSLMAAITLFGGLIQLSVGVVGLYIAKIYSEAKRRPLYIISEER